MELLLGVTHFIEKVNKLCEALHTELRDGGINFPFNLLDTSQYTKWEQLVHERLPFSTVCGFHVL